MESSLVVLYTFFLASVCTSPLDGKIYFSSFFIDYCVLYITRFMFLHFLLIIVIFILSAVHNNLIITFVCEIISCYYQNTNDMFKINMVTVTDPQCPEIPTVENAEVSTSSVKNKYIKGDLLTYICQQGFVGRVIFICDGHCWENTRNSKCSRTSTSYCIWRIFLCIQ